MSFGDAATGDLVVAVCGDANCTSLDLRVVDELAHGARYTSIAVAPDGLPFMVYQGVGASSNSPGLKWAKCTVPDCSSSTFGEGDFTDGGDRFNGPAGFHASLAIVPEGAAVVSHQLARSNTDSYLRYVRCGSVVGSLGCSFPTTLEGGDPSVTGLHTSIAVGPDGLPVISYYNETAGQLKVAKCLDPANCAPSFRNVADSPAGAHTSITLGVDGLPLVTYRDGTTGALKVAHCSNGFCVPHWRPR